MEKETPESSVSSQEFQIEPLSFLDKIKIHKFKIVGGILGFFVLTGAVFGAYKFGQKQIQPTPQPTPTLMVTPIPTLTPEVTPILTPTPTPIVIATPTYDPTANWETYKNTKYGYSIKYPNEAVSEDIEANQVLGPTGLTAHSFIIWGPTQKLQTEFYDGLWVILGVVANSQSLPLQAFVDQISQSTVGERESFEDIQIGELQGFKVVGVGLGRFTHIFLPYKTPDRVIQITGSWGGEKKEKYGENFNLMLSTFRFLPSTSSDQGE